MRMPISLAAVLAALACTRAPAGREGQAQGSAPAQAAPVVQAPSVLHAAAAEFVGEELDACVDATMGLAPDVAAADKARLQGELEEGVLRRLKNPTKLPSTCAQRFGDRPVFGTCVTTSAPTHLTVVSHRYRFSTVYGSDAAMNECAQAKGRWRPLPRESAEILKAQAHRGPRDAG